VSVTVPSSFERDLAEFAGRRGGDFEIAADRDAAQLAGLSAVLLTLREARVVGHFQRLGEYGAEIAAVIGDA
jgi:hypothetical protein